MSTPLTQIKICSGVHLDNRYSHTIYFPSREAQREYFAGKVVKTFPAYSHHRRNWEVKVEATVAAAQGWNYLYVDNPGVKTYYYFINKVEYVSDTTVKLFLELDVIQTHLFEMNLLPCFIERQHTTTDVVGEHTIPEGLEQGPYFNYHVYNMEDIAEMGVLVLSSINLTMPVSKDEHTQAYGQVYNGVYSGLGVYAFNNVGNLEIILKALDEAGKADAITAIWMYPKNLVRVKQYYLGYDFMWDGFEAWDEVTCAYVSSIDSITAGAALYKNYDYRIFQGYEPKNNKLYTYPYNLLYVTGNQGAKAEYRFEYFDTPEEKYLFRLFGAVSPDAGVKLAPDCYNMFGSNVNYDEGLTIVSFPPCAWDSDTYKVWLAQNYNQLNHSTETAVGSALMGVGMIAAGAIATAATSGLGAAAGIGAVGAGVSTLYSAYNQVGAIMAQKEDAKAQPPQSKGAFSSTVNVAAGRQTFTFYYKCIRPEYARQIDDFFTMYGYRLNRVQQPVINARPAFTYVKTVGCKVGGAICNEDTILIEKIFDTGLTFWKNGDKIGDYSQDNSV